MSKAAMRALACCGGTGGTSTHPGGGKGVGKPGPKPHGRGAHGVMTY